MPTNDEKSSGRPVDEVDELTLPVLHLVSALQMVLTSLVQLQSLLIDARFPNAERPREWADSMQGLSGNIDEAYRVVSTVTDQLVGIARRKVTMSDPIQIDEARRRRDQALAEVARSGGGGHDGGMSDLERRVGSLEAKADRILVDLAGVRVELAELRGKVSQLPTVWMLVFANFGLAVTVSALVFAIARAMK